MNLPLEETHTMPVRDSRGLPMRWAGPRGGLSLAPGGCFIPEDSPTGETAPCIVCGEPAPILSAAREQPYAACPVLQAEACVVRALKKRTAARAAEQAAAAAAAAQQETQAPKPPSGTVTPKRRSRPSQARKTMPVQGPAKAAGDAS